MFIVVPLITDNKVVYGIYSVCISTAIFLGYADLGFFSAGIKYAGESYAKGEHESELKFHGFSGFVLFIFVSLIAAVYLLFSFNPSLLIKGLENSEYLSIASKLLFIQALFSYNTVLQRFVTGVFQVRIEQYNYQRISIYGSIVKISSVFYFFSSGKYDIVGYFLFLKVIDLLTILISILIIYKKYKISFIKYLYTFKFDKTIYKRTKGLAFSSLFVTFMWILYYEFDLIAIGAFLGASAVAVYSVAFIFMRFLRSLSSLIFSPFQNRYNHFIGFHDFQGLKILLMKVVQFSMPIIIFLVLSVIILSNNIVSCLAGNEYIESGIILFLLASNFMFSFIRIPGSNILVTLVRIKEMYWINLSMVVVFWLGVFLSMNYIGIISFALFKLISGILSLILYLKILLRFLDKSLIEFLKETIFTLIIPITIQVSFLLFVVQYLPDIKSKLNLLIVVVIGGVGSMLGFITLYFTSKYYKGEYNHYLSKILVR